MNNHSGVNYLFNVLFHQTMAAPTGLRRELNYRLSQYYISCTSSQRFALDAVFSDLFHQSFFNCFNADQHYATTVKGEMPSYVGVDYLFDVLFHEIMAAHPIVQDDLNRRIAQHYIRYNVSQRQALDTVFCGLFKQSFLNCFSVDIRQSMPIIKNRVLSVTSSVNARHP